MSWQLEYCEEGGGLNAGSFGAMIQQGGSVFTGSSLMGELSHPEELPCKLRPETLRELLLAVKALSQMHVPPQRFGPNPLTIMDGWTETLILRIEDREFVWEATVGDWGVHHAVFRDVISGIKKAVHEARGR